MQRVLSPVKLETLFLLDGSGWSAERVLRVLVEQMNDVKNAPGANGPTPQRAPEFEDFQRLAGLFRALELRDMETTCESINNRENRCRMDTTGGVRMVRQLSSAACVEGRTWDFDRSGVWVNGGCRAIFAAEGGGYSQPSYSTGGTPSSLPNRVTCESHNNRREECPMDTRGEVRMVNQLSKSSCTEGRTYGFSKHSVWVSNGCRAMFESAGTGPAYDNDPAYGGGAPANPGNVPSSLVRACNAVEDRYGQVVSSAPLKPGHWEVILEYDDGQYVCNVGPGDRVTYFEKMRR